MRSFWIVALYSCKELVRSKGFRITTVLSLVLIAALFAVPGLGVEETELLHVSAKAYILSFILYITTGHYCYLIGKSFVRDRQSRMTDILMTRIHSPYLMFGKVAGIGACGVLQLLLITLGLLFNWNFSNLNGLDMLFLFLFALLGFAFYAVLYAGISSLLFLGGNIKTAVLPVFLFLTVGFLLSLFAACGTNMNTIKIISFIPFMTPFMMIVRIIQFKLTLFQMLIPLCILAGAMSIVCSISFKIYQFGHRTDGRRPTLKEIL
ncbi:ABC transporter permease [Paenibacillus sp. MSJ-34]|uniref:ABC transporter permease n=1 Tax=Paenibacillus sp. MSJ-34 TaxID=2841529 RepID=UPI001C0F58C8|nr:ABC transporter permease [Paenibacillus sp. MSJ-34]MBU5443338.1 ABC transporter permease [Paenibacillus sp. MSJ-34]